MKRLMADLDKANNVLESITRIANDNGLHATVDENMIISVDISSLAKISVVDDINDKDLGVSMTINSEKYMLNTELFRKTVDSMGADSLDKNVKLLSDATGISVQSIKKYYYSEESEISIFHSTFSKMKKFLMKNSESMSEKNQKAIYDMNMIMIRRVMRAKNTEDPDIIAKTISSSGSMLRQTTFKNYDDIISFIRRNQIANPNSDKSKS